MHTVIWEYLNTYLLSCLIFFAIVTITRKLDWQDFFTGPVNAFIFSLFWPVLLIVLFLGWCAMLLEEHNVLSRLNRWWNKRWSIKNVSEKP